MASHNKMYAAQDNSTWQRADWYEQDSWHSWRTKEGCSADAMPESMSSTDHVVNRHHDGDHSSEHYRDRCWSTYVRASELQAVQDRFSFTVQVLSEDCRKALTKQAAEIEKLNDKIRVLESKEPRQLDLADTTTRQIAREVPQTRLVDDPTMRKPSFCKHHESFPVIDGGVYATFGASWATVDDAWFGHLQSTLFKDFQAPHGEIWTKATASEVKGLLKLDSCKTQANRYFDVRCTGCGRHCNGRYSVWSSDDEKMRAMDNLCRFFGVQDCSSRTENTGCHVSRKDAIVFLEDVDV